MIKTGTHPCFAAIASKIQFRNSMKWFCGLLAILWFAAPTLNAVVEDPEAEFLKIFSVIDQADTLNEGGNKTSAKTKYQQAQRALLNLKKNHPIWNTKVVGFRLKYVEEKIAALTQPPSTAQPAEPGAAPKSDGKSASAPSGAQVKLLDAGAEPRKPLRIRAKPGDKQVLDMTMKIAMDMEIGGLPAQAIKMPGIKMNSEMTVKEVSSDGDITLETVMGEAAITADADVMPQVADAIKASFESLKGLSGSRIISSRGLAKETDIKLPAGADAQTRQAVEQMRDSFTAMTIGFPEEPVGPGARWEVKLPLKSQGMTIDQTTTYELAALEGQEFTVKSTVTQQAANQQIENPSMPGLKMDVTKMTAKGTGRATINLAHILPSQATVDSKSEMAMTMNMGGQKQTMTMKMDIHLLLESK